MRMTPLFYIKANSVLDIALLFTALLTVDVTSCLE